MKEKYPFGTMRVPRRRAYRLISFVRGLGWFIVALTIAIGVLSFIQLAYHPFDALIDQAETELAAMDDFLQSDAFAGVSFGTLLLVVAVAVLPLLRRGVRKGQYLVSFWRGLVSSAIFLATDRLYRYVQALGRLYLSATLALFVAATIILVEIISRVGHVEAEAEKRTEFLASIVSGLVFGLLVQLAERVLGKI